MRTEIETLIDEIKKSLMLYKTRVNFNTISHRLEELNKRAEDPDVWKNTNVARALMKKRTNLERELQMCLNIDKELSENIELIELSESCDDAEMLQITEKTLEILHKKMSKLAMEALLSGEMDNSDAYLEVHAGAGGTESCDWAEMLLRMYLRWAEKRAYTVELISETSGEEAGIRSALIQIKGDYVFGWLKTEAGVHRLVRISPFDSQSRRHTSFSSVWVYPVIDDNIAIEIQDKDLRIDTFRSSGAGGQHVNTTDSAVRITHLPTGIAVVSSEKSQHQNRANAMKVLRARLYDLELKKRQESAQENHSSKSEIGWGHQIRSYVLHPYQMIKDLRTNAQTPNTHGFLDGDLDDFMMETLAFQLAGKSRAEASSTEE
jgi:peptide chain release factor 2